MEKFEIGCSKAKIGSQSNTSSSATSAGNNPQAKDSEYLLPSDQSDDSEASNYNTPTLCITQHKNEQLNNHDSSEDLDNASDNVIKDKN